MTLPSFYQTSLWSIVSITLSVCAQLNGAEKPNIILIYTDDQGYGDVSALNPEAKFKTPNLDQLAHEGISFTNGHSPDSICTPSRYGLLTGRYSWRTTLKTGVFGAEKKCLIPDERLTIASMLKKQGYHTAMVGKWHLGMDFPGESHKDRDWSKPVRDMPLDKGFDYFYGIPASLNYGVLAWFEGRHAKVPPVLFSNKKKNPRYLDYRIMPPYEQTAKPSKDPTRTIKSNFEIAEDFIDNQCLTRFTDKAIEWMKGKATDAKSGTPFFLYLPYTSPHYPVCPLPEFHGQGQAGPYGEFVIETDYHVGRILTFLKEAGLDENTMVIYSSDNGPEKSWTNRLKKTGHDSRGGYKDGKRSVYEGGHRVPFLIRWPKSITKPGRTWDGVIGQTDILATLAEIVEAKLPENAGEDSQSFASVLLDPLSKHQRLPLITHGNPYSDYALTDGNWKLIMRQKNGLKPELYNLANDRVEKNNLASKNAELVKTMLKKLNAIIARGRTTPGPLQANDTGYWKELHWMTQQQYNDLAAPK